MDYAEELGERSRKKDSRGQPLYECAGNNHYRFSDSGYVQGKYLHHFHKLLYQGDNTDQRIVSVKCGLAEGKRPEVLGIMAATVHSDVTLCCGFNGLLNRRYA